MSGQLNSGVPDWVRQSIQTCELLADLLEKDILFDRIPDKALKLQNNKSALSLAKEVGESARRAENFGV